MYRGCSPTLKGFFTGQFQGLVQNSSGSILLETVIASIIFSLVGVAVLVGLSNAYYSGNKTETQSVAENTARNQIEFVFSQPYREPQQTPYPTFGTVPAGYSLTTTVGYVDVGSPNPEVERINVATTYDGREVLSIETVRGRADGLQLRYSAVNDRSGSTRMAGKTVNGTVYVFLEDPELLATQVKFYLDSDPIPVQTEVSIPWDYQGGGVPTANSWDTATDPAAFDGNHRIIAEVDLTSGGTINVTADFVISNP